ncbi:MAG: Decarbamoylnovobiocin carbamoyltransferase [Planctomycetes bacterium]|nr:Decarbamoylnovobiocin carbamoyltransferase [Planctomycetota bacterium]
MSPRLVLGINKYDHDVSAALLRDGVPAAAIAKERISRVKYDGGLPDVAVGYCLKAAGVKFDEVGRIVQNSYALAIPELEQDLLSRVHALHLPDDEREILERSPLFRNPGAATISHHLAHAYSAFACSPFEEGVVLVVDGIGSHRRDVTEALPPGDEGHPADRECESEYAFRGTELTCLRKSWLPVMPSVLNEDFTRFPGLGAVYSRVAEYVFHHWNKCGEVMGLAAYGAPDPAVPPLMGVRDGRTWALQHWPDLFRRPFIPGDGDDRAKWESHPAQQEWRNLCRRVQEDLEDALLARARDLHRRTGATNLVLAGGVFMNCVANARIAREGPFRNVWVQPAAGDQGIALGCALYGELALERQPRRFVMTHDAFGRVYDDAAIDAALATKPWAPFLRVTKSADIAADTARALAEGKIVGWFQGGSELGPRALGHRSILSDPRSAAAKERLNARVKHRQAFRPFAPAVPIEHADEWFEPGPPSPAMTFVRRIRAHRLDRLAAVAHADGTARLQTVDAATEPLFHRLLLEFGKATGVPVIVNTSFNVRGEPIVETPEDALLCFLGTDMDLLVLHDRIVEKRGAFQPLRRFLFELSKAQKAESIGQLLRQTAARFAGRA